MTQRIRFWGWISMVALATFVCLGMARARAADTLDIYFVDVGGAVGNATILVSPSGESAMLDAGLPFMAQKVADVLKQAGVKQLDYLINSHFHSDHFGGTANLANLIPVVNFVDHGDSVEVGKSDDWWKERRAPWFRVGMGKQYDDLYATYLKAVEKGKRIAVKPGDVVPVKGIEVKVVCAGGKVISEPLPGAGQPNPACQSEGRRGDDDAEDGQSIGALVTYGAFKFIYMGDLTWNVALDLFCPRNKVGTVDAYLVTHHAQSMPASLGSYYHGLSACPKAEVYGLHPRVAFLSLGFNGHKNGTSEAIENVHSSPGLEDVWQTALVTSGGEKGHNSPEQFCANAGKPSPQALYIKLSASKDGSFTVTNSRNGFSKSYPARPKP